MDGTNHSRGSTIQSLSPDKREGLEHELRPEALASIAREENAEASTNTTHAAVSPKESTKTRAETASTGLVPPHESSTHTDRAVRTDDYLQPPDADRRGRRRALGRGVAVRGGIVRLMFYSPIPRTSMACSSLAPGRWKPRVSRTEKSCGATDKSALFLERKPRELPIRR